MKINIKTTNIELTLGIKKAIEEKISSVGKFIPNVPVEAFVEIAKETKHHQKGKIYCAEANINLPGAVIRSEAKEDNIYKAVNEVKDELQRLLKKYKSKKFQDY